MVESNEEKRKRVMFNREQELARWNNAEEADQWHKETREWRQEVYETLAFIETQFSEIYSKEPFDVEVVIKKISTLEAAMSEIHLTRRWS